MRCALPGTSTAGQSTDHLRNHPSGNPYEGCAAEGGTDTRDVFSLTRR
ncbi:MAG: hypothetical protein IPH40_07000 [Polaromonas sp.]|nr:hypothetical protein [Polaromonas sp.]